MRRKDENGLGQNVNAGLYLPWRAVPGRPLAQYVEAPFGLMSESVSTDFYELRQEFIPPIQIRKRSQT